MGKKKYDIFISYRRVGGEATARIICERLTDLGYSVFFDVESLRSGDFNTKLYSVIEECNDFLIILSPDSLDRCSAENDWVRLEIAHALAHDKNIIPILLRGFNFPDELPEDIAGLRNKNGIEANSEFFDAFINKLTGFLATKPALTKRISQNNVIKRTLPFIIALFITAGVIYGGTALYNNFKVKPFPYTQEEKNISSEVLDYVGRNLVNANLMIGKASEAYSACENYLESQNAVEYENLVSQVQKCEDDISGFDIKKEALRDQLDLKVDRTPIKKDDLIALNVYLEQLRTEILDNLQFINYLVGPDVFLDNLTKKQVLEIYMELLDINRKIVVYSTNSLLLPLDENFLDEFKHERLTELTHLQFDENMWLAEESDVENQLTTSVNRYQELISNLSSIVGNENMEYAKALASYKEQLKKLGLSEQEIDQMVANMVKTSDNITKLKKDLLDSEARLRAMYIEAQEKFKPLETDEPGMLWGKMLRFLNLGLYEDAKKCVQVYHIKVRAADEQADTYVPIVLDFIDNIKDSGIDYGIMIIGYEPGITRHEIYSIGDIIIAVNNKICMNFNSYNSYKVHPGDSVTVLRKNSEGKLVSMNLTVVENQSKVLMVDLTEKE